MPHLEEDCEANPCTRVEIEACKALWDEKKVECEEHAEEWAHMCPAPMYNGRDCKDGCCSEFGQQVQEGGGDELPPPEEVWDYISGEGDTITPAELESALYAKLPPILHDHVG